MAVCCREGPNNQRSPPTPSKHNHRPKVRTHEGWKLQWASPKKTHRDVIRAVIPGPFLKPRLLKALPYVVISSCDYCSEKNDPLIRLRNGIPDPWLEYLAWKESLLPGNEFMTRRDVRLDSEYVRLTDFVWNEKGLPMLQGIPDPWKVDMQFRCDEIHEITPRIRKKKKFKGKDTDAKGMDDFPKKKPKTRKSEKSPNKLTREEASQEPQLMEGKKNGNGFDRVKKKLSKLDEELKARHAEKEPKMREIEQLAKKLETRDNDDNEMRRRSRKVSRGKEKSPYTVKTTYEDNLREEKKLKKEWKRDKASISQDTVATEHRETKSRNLKNDNKNNTTYGGREELEIMLKKIDGRIKITRDVLDSPDMSNDRLPREEAATKACPIRVRGAGDNEQLFFKRRYDNFLVEQEEQEEEENKVTATQMVNDIEIETRIGSSPFFQWKNSQRKRDDDDKKDESSIFMESYTD